MVIIDEKLLAAFRRAEWCSWCGKPTPDGCHPHHLESRGQGGGTRVDHVYNLISLCFLCHHQTHNHQRPFYCDLLAKVAARENVLQGDIENEMRRIHNAPKPHKKLRKVRKR